MDAGPLGANGFRGEDYMPATWQGGIFQGKRYAIPLDVPQHALYFNVKIMKDAGLVGPDGQPKVPASGAELVAMAKQIAKDDTFGFVIGSGLNIPGVHLWLPSHALAERGERLHGRTSSAPRLPSRRQSRRPSSGERSHPAQDGAARRPRTPAMSSLLASSGCGWPGPGTSLRYAGPRSTSRSRPCLDSLSSPSSGRSRISMSSPSPRPPTPRSAPPPGPTSVG